MKTTTNLKAGGLNRNHNETLVREDQKQKPAAEARGMKVRTNLKVGHGPTIPPDPWEE